MSLFVVLLTYFCLLLVLAVVSASETAIHSARDVEARPAAPRAVEQLLQTS